MSKQLTRDYDLDYDWLASDGAIDVTAKMKLRVRVSAEVGLFRLDRLIAVQCEEVNYQSGCTSFLDNSTLRHWFRDRFQEHYDANTHNLEDDVEAAACAVFGPDLAVEVGV